MVNFANMWSNWFTTENLSNVLLQTNKAISYFFKINTQTANDIANALAAEVYSAWRPGLGVPAGTPNSQYSWNEPCYGGYGFTSKRGDKTVALARDSSILLQAISKGEMANADWRERMEGFNFVSTSANMLSPSGSVITAIYIP